MQNVNWTTAQIESLNRLISSEDGWRYVGVNDYIVASHPDRTPINMLPDGSVETIKLTETRAVVMYEGVRFFYAGI